MAANATCALTKFPWVHSGWVLTPTYTSLTNSLWERVYPQMVTGLVPSKTNGHQDAMNCFMFSWYVSVAWTLFGNNKLAAVPLKPPVAQFGWMDVSSLHLLNQQVERGKNWLTSGCWWDSLIMEKHFNPCTFYCDLLLSWRRVFSIHVFYLSSSRFQRWNITSPLKLQEFKITI